MTRLADAMVYAATAHRDDVRKGSDTAYVTHLIDVCARVIAMDGSVDAQIAALLHDVVEDHGIEHLDPIRGQFGSDVARIVERCSDSVEIPKPPWLTRKVAYIGRLRNHLDDHEYVIVTLADKLSNAHAIRRDHTAIGDAVYALFINSGTNDGERKHSTLSYYADLARTFAAADLPAPVAAAANELQALITTLGATPTHTLATP